MKTVCKKLLSLMLVAVLLVSAVPMMANATDCGHNDWDGGSIKTPATCTTTGLMEYKCQTADCGATKEEIIPATNHNMDGGTQTKAPTCTEEGVMTYKCTNPNCVETSTSPIPALGHTWVQTSVKQAATCGKAGIAVETCSTCQAAREVEIPATGVHNFGSWTITKKATATTDGEMTRFCECGASETQIYKATVKTISFINSYVGNTQTTKVDYVVGETVSLPAGTPVAGYTFKGWFTEANGNGSQLTDGTTCTENLAAGYYAYYIKDVKFDYDVYLNIYTNNKVDAPAKRINITSGIAADGVVSLSEVKSVVQNYYTSKDSNGITYDGLYMATGDWVDKFNRNDKEDTFSNIGDLKEQDNVFINVMITNVKEKTSSSSGSTADSSNPKTGDGIYTTVAVFGLSVASLAAVYYIGKKRFAC